MSVLGAPPMNFMDRGGLEQGGLPPPPLVPQLWRPALWCTSPTCPDLPLYPQPRTMTRLLDDYYVPPPLWYPWYFKGESLYKRTSPHDDRESPSKELPSKFLKLERLKERQDLSQTLNFDKDHAEKYSLKKTCTAGTQTQFTSFNGDNYNYNNSTSSTDAYSSWHGLPPPPPFPSQKSSPSREAEAASPGVQNAPLNLSLASNGSMRSPGSARPSVITCSSGSLHNGTRYIAHSPSSSPTQLSPTANHPDIPAVINDPAIEEHFRRSLGKNYKETIPAKPPTIAIVKENVSITGSVDDHFAKSLGDTTWTAIKAKTDPIKDMFSGSVDDHFAKALGDTWLRIKAEKETGCLSSSCSSPSGSPQHTSVLTT